MTVIPSREAVNDQRTSLQEAWARCGYLTAATLGVWLLLALPAWSLAGPLGLEGMSYAALLCLLPGWLVFLLGSRYGVANAPVAVAVLGSTTLRLLFVLVGTLVIQSVRPDLRFREFIVWLLVLYMTTLAIETNLLLKRPSK